MSDTIYLSPGSAANQIAADEMIQRPASITKKLVENATGADAQNIHVLMTNAGKTRTQMIDDGRGVSEMGARLSPERYTTSKIREAAGLFALRTMGFYGEALVSIATVAQMELRTRPEPEELGMKLATASSQVESRETISCSKGSNFSAKNLSPSALARYKFLKANSTELSDILAEFKRIALMHPGVVFSPHSNDSGLSSLLVSQLRQCIPTISSKKLNQRLLNIDVNTTMMKIPEYIAKLETARKKGTHQYLLVNGRYACHPYFHKVVIKAYRQLIPADEQISYFTYFDVDPVNIDVNIHPTKTEIKFKNEQAIWQISSASVEELLGKFSAIPSTDFDTEGMPDIPAFGEKIPPKPPEVYHNIDCNPFGAFTGGGGGGSHSRSKIEQENSYGGLTKASKMNNPQPEPEMDWGGFSTGGELTFVEEKIKTVTSVASSTLYANELMMEKGNRHLQFKGWSILTSVKSGPILIDQYRAHIRVPFGCYMIQTQRKQEASQGALFPGILQLPASEVVVLQGTIDDLLTTGFDLSDLEGGSRAINGIPSGIERLNPVELVRNMLHIAMEKRNDVKGEIQNILALTSVRTAVTIYGQVLSNKEMVSPVDNLSACPPPNYTPDGKTVLTTIKEENIEKLFK